MAAREAGSTPRQSAMRNETSSMRMTYAKLDQSTGYLVRRTFRAFTRSLEHRLRSHGISLSMWYFLRLLWEKDGATQKELSDELGLMQPTTVTAMDNMEKSGLIERRRNATDRRKVNIFLTRKGAALKDKLLPYAAEVNRAALQDLSEKESRLLQDILIRIIDSLGRDDEMHIRAGRRARIAR